MCEKFEDCSSRRRALDAPPGFSCLSSPCELAPSSGPNLDFHAPAHLQRQPSPKPCSAIFSRAAPVPAWLHCLPGVWCCDKGPHGSRNDTVSPSPSWCSDRDCLNSILSRGRVPWQLHKYLPAEATPLRLRSARPQATSAVFFFCPFFSLLSLATVVCVVLMISFGSWCLFFFFLSERGVFTRAAFAFTHHHLTGISGCPEC